MHLVGRYEKVVLAGAHGIGPPMILDRKWHRLSSYRQGEWISDGRLWRPAIRGGAGSWNYLTHRSVTFPSWPISQTMNTVALDSAFTYNSAGDAYALRLGPFPERLKVFAANINVSSYTGTAANVNDIEIQIRDDGGAGKPGSTVHQEQIHDPQSATGWRRQTGFSFTLSNGTIYWVTVSDADGNGTDFAVMRARYTGSNTGRNVNMSYSDTTDGWATPTTQLHIASIVLELEDGRVIGNPMTADATVTSGTYERGWLFRSGFGGRVKIFGFTAGNAFGVSTLLSVKVYGEGVNPGGATLGTGTEPLLGENGQSHMGMAFTSPLSLPANQLLRIVWDFNNASTNPRKASIGAGAVAALRRALWGQGDFVWTEESGGVWVDDNDAQPCDASVLLSDFDAVEASPPGTSVYPLRRMMS